MSFRNRIEEIERVKSIYNIDQLPSDIKIEVNILKRQILEKYTYSPALSECLWLLKSGKRDPDICKKDGCGKIGAYNRRNGGGYQYCSRKCSDTCNKRNQKIQTLRTPKINYGEVHKKVVETKNIVGPDGLNTHQRIGIRVSESWQEDISRTNRIESIRKFHSETTLEYRQKKSKKREETNINRYGSTHAGGVGNSKIRDQIIRGTEFKNIQGYEDILIYELLETGVKPEDIEPCSRLMKHSFEYEYLGKKHRYFPDIFVISAGKYYEAKSEFWYNKELEKNLVKKAAVDNLELKVYDGKYAKEIRIRIREENKASEGKDFRS